MVTQFVPAFPFPSVTTYNIKINGSIVTKCVHVLNMFKANRKYQTAQKIKFFIKDFFSKCEEITEEILNGKVHFFVHSERIKYHFQHVFACWECFVQSRMNHFTVLFGTLKDFLEAFTVFTRLLEKLQSAKNLKIKFLPVFLQLG